MEGLRNFITQLAQSAQGFFRNRGGGDVSAAPQQQPMQPTPDPWEQKGWTKAGGGYLRKDDPTAFVDKEKIPQEMLPQQAPVQTPRPESSLFEFGNYQQAPGFDIQQPPSALADIMRDVFGDDAEKAAVVAGTENPGYDPTAVGQNKDGSTDIGIMQINSKTLEDFMARKPKAVHEAGINSLEDLYDPIKNIKMAKIIMQEQGWNAWYGPKNKGYTVE